MGEVLGADVCGNQLTSHSDKRTPESRCTYQYDEFGRVISEKRGQSKPRITRYEYDCQHRLTKAILPDGRQATYKYDAFGRRIKKTVTDKSGKPTTTEFLWQGDNLIAETDNKEHYQSYIYEPNSFKPLALIVGRGKEHKVYHYQLDHIGTPLDLTNREGKAVWSAQYLAYGTIYTQHTEEVTNPLRFQGQYFDQETGLHYNRHRYYNPKNGLFTTADPIGLAGGLNNYQYVKNPIGFVDPLGLASVDEVCNCSNDFSNTRYSGGANRNTIPLNQTQQQEVLDYAKELGTDAENIRFYSYNAPSNYSDLLDTVFIGPDIFPSNNMTNSVIDRLSMKSTLAHEVVGHRYSTLAGRDFEPGSLLDEFQASYRAAKLAPNLSNTERFQLLKDSVRRLHLKGITVREFKATDFDKLYLD